MAFLHPTYAPAAVALSVLIGTFASFVALDLVRQVRSQDVVTARYWLVGGSLAIAAGIWSMHFTGMHAFVVPIQIGYGKWLTFLSFVAAFGVSVVALSIAARKDMTTARLAAGAALMGGGICAMHYLGMAAIDLAPGIVWRWPLVALSAVIAVGASAAALFIFSWLPTTTADTRFAKQAGAALVMGLAISGMHYCGMAAAQFPADAVCVTTGALGGTSLTDMAYVTAFLLLSCALLTSSIEAHMQRRSETLAASLETAQARIASADTAMRRNERIDPLTGLSNRVAFEERLAEAIEGRRRMPTRGRLAVLFANITGLRPINEALGHASGDEVIRQFALRLVEQVRGDDVAARLDGDRFLILMSGIERRDDCATVAERVIAAAQTPFDVLGRSVQAGVSIGIALQDDENGDQDLILESDTAMQAARHLGRSGYRFFEPQMGRKMSDEFDMVADLRQAIDQGQLDLHYQPKIDSRRGDLCGVEALLRWTHPVRGPVSPAVFIPLAERFDLINALGNWVIEKACAQMGAWQADGVALRVAINLSAQQLRETDLVARIRAALERHGVDPSFLLCEITESVAMQDFATTQRTLEGLGAIGIFLSIDDFGTGYSSLSYLRQLPAKQLKIDRSFVNDLETSADARALVDAVVRLSHALGLQVVAEGVETAGQRDILVRLACDELQGFYFARPMAAPRLVEWMATRVVAATRDVPSPLSLVAS